MAERGAAPEAQDHGNLFLIYRDNRDESTLFVCDLLYTRPALDDLFHRHLALAGPVQSMLRERGIDVALVLGFFFSFARGPLGQTRVLHVMRSILRLICMVWQMQDRPDLIQSELAGLAFDSLQQVFRKSDVAIAFDSPCMPFVQDQVIWIVIDPAAGGPSSDYAVVSMCRHKGCVTVSFMRCVCLCENVCLPAVVDKHSDGDRFVYAKMLDDWSLEVHEETLDLAVVLLDFIGPDLIFKFCVDIQQEQEECDQCVVWCDGHHALERLNRLRGVAVEVLNL